MELPKVPFYLREKYEENIYKCHSIHNGNIYYTCGNSEKTETSRRVSFTKDMIASQEWLICDINGNEIKESKMTIDEQMEILQARKEGKVIQSKSVIDLEYRLYSGDIFDFVNYSYEIIEPPKKREMTFREAVDFIRENPDYEIINNARTVCFFSGLYYNTRCSTIWNEEKENLRWRENPDNEWKRFERAIR